MSEFNICVDISGDLAEKLTLIALANEDEVWSVITRLLDKKQVAEAHDKACRHIASGGLTAGVAPAVSGSPSSQADKPSVAVVVGELPYHAPDELDELDDRDAPDVLRCVNAYHDWMGAAAALLARHEQEQPDGCDCGLCDDLAGQRYALEGWLSCLEGQLPARYVHVPLLREDQPARSKE